MKIKMEIQKIGTLLQSNSGQKSLVPYYTFCFYNKFNARIHLYPGSTLITKEIRKEFRRWKS